MYIILYYYYGNSPVSEKEYLSTKMERDKILLDITELKSKLALIESRFELLDSIYNPKVTIIEVNNKSMGHRYTGKFRIVSEYGEKKEITISIGKVEDFEGNDDPKLLEIAKQKALKRIRKKFPYIFT